MIAYFVKGPQHGLIMDTPDPPLPMWDFMLPDINPATWIAESKQYEPIRLKRARYYMTENRDIYVFGGIS